MSSDKKDKPLEYHLYDVKVECTVPASMVFKVKATSPEEALKNFDKSHPTQFHPHIARRKVSKATVYSSGSVLVRATKNYR